MRLIRSVQKPGSDKLRCFSDPYKSGKGTLVMTPRTTTTPPTWATTA
jgi:hypothetical protein